MPKTDKIIVGNDSALTAKYGVEARQIRAAIAAWIAADGVRGLKSVYLPVDSAAKMSAYGVPPVTPGDEPSHKVAIDAISKRDKPDYLVLLGAPDLFPHITLKNPTYNASKPDDDPDQYVPSDLPYACDQPYSAEPGDFVGPTRVVTRLPDLQGVGQLDYFLEILKFAKSATSRTRSDYSPYLAATASVWKKSTSLSLDAVFGDATALKPVPPATYRWKQTQLSNLAHFFNCHGASNDSHYYGQHGKNYPIAHDAVYLKGKIQRGTVLAAECCYGAELYDPSLVHGQMGIANTYMEGGAYAVWGSTTIAYGPAKTNGQADLICQFFFEELLKSSSVGAAALSARQRFASSAPTLAPSDLKTLVQFICLGDASLHCVASERTAPLTKKGTGLSQLADRVSGWGRSTRRASSVDDGKILSLFQRRASSEDVPITANTRKRILKIAAEYKVQAPSLLSKGVIEPAGPKLLRATPNDLAEFDEAQAFHLVFEHQDNNRLLVRRRVLEIGESAGRITMIRELFAR